MYPKSLLSYKMDVTVKVINWRFYKIVYISVESLLMLMNAIDYDD